ncbi:MAG TPA: class I SAM-dependent methyltransferase [Steroidobacteraceae bacterium]|jgi:2-polyprenyl-3-methyl-5-hydroxy-6-metoxy-1,4-benzoquinol methylase
MNSRDPQEQEIINSWHLNAAPWARAIRTASIASRKFVTDQAIIDAVCSVACRRILDVGCGEGWLARVLSDLGMSVTGVDVVPELVSQAAAMPPGSAGDMAFHLQDYASIANRRWRCGPFDAAVCNFSLLGRESVDSLLAALPWYLDDPGYLIVQTLHPVAACGERPYQDGWRDGSWQGFGGDFNNPAPWYFRTLETWMALLQRCGFDILERREPKAAGAVTPASVIWIGKLRRSAQTGDLVNGA